MAHGWRQGEHNYAWPPSFKAREPMHALAHEQGAAHLSACKTPAWAHGGINQIRQSDDSTQSD